MDALVPRSQSLATRPSLSARYGVAAFPAHVDGAHEPIPPRYVLLYCTVDEQRRYTRLFPWESVERTQEEECHLSREVFAFRSGANSFLDSVLDPARPFIRLDPGCMTPRTLHAAALVRGIATAIEGSAVVNVVWRPRQIVLIDNWRTLHGRAPALRLGRRELIRYTFDL